MLIYEEVSKSREEVRALSRRQPQSRTSLTERLEEVEACWSSLQDKACQRRVRLGQAKAVQEYISHWTELM